MPRRLFYIFPLGPWVIEDTRPQYRERMRQHAAKLLASARACHAKGSREHPYQAIIDPAASKDCDLILVASHGRCGVAAIVPGSETVKVLTYSRIFGPGPSLHMSLSGAWFVRALESRPSPPQLP